MEMSGTWEVQQCLVDGHEYADRMEVTLEERKRCWKSDPLIVLRARESRVHGEAAGPESTCSRDTFAIHRDGERMKTKLDRIAEKAKTDGKLRFTALAHLLTPEFLMETWKQVNKRGVSGIDQETTTEFASNLEERCRDLVARLKARRYHAPPVLRAEIPKGDGKTRLLQPGLFDRNCGCVAPNRWPVPCQK